MSKLGTKQTIFFLPWNSCRDLSLSSGSTPVIEGALDPTFGAEPSTAVGWPFNVTFSIAMIVKDLGIEWKKKR